MGFNCVLLWFYHCFCLCLTGENRCYYYYLEVQEDFAVIKHEDCLCTKKYISQKTKVCDTPKKI